MKVRCILRPGRRNISWLSGLSAQVEYASLTDPAALAPLLADADYVVHVAGVTRAARERDFVLGNVETTRALLKALESSSALRKFCLISSLAAAGPSPGTTPIDETAPPRPITRYGASKLAAEELCKAASANIPVVVVRPPTVFGPRDRDVLELFRWAAYGLFPVTGPRDKKLSLIHARDLAQAIHQATVHPDSAGKTYFVANEQPYGILEIASKVGSLLGKRVRNFGIPRWVAQGISALSQLVLLPFGKPALLSFDKVRDLFEPRWTCDPARILREVGFRPMLSLEAGLRDTIEWYRKHRWL